MSGTITRLERVYRDFNLANKHERIIVPTPNARALRIVAVVMVGTWATSGLKVRVGCGVVARDFASAKAMAGGAGSADILITWDEMKAVEEIWIERDTGSAVDAGTLLEITVKEEDEN